MEAKLLKSAILRINNRIRPYPSLFFFPGIRTIPIWNKNELPAVKTLEQNYSIIKEEYETALKTHKLSNDYRMIDQEQSLHQGNWEWFSYISKGAIQQNFKEVFPKTFNILENIEERMTDLPFAYTFFSRLNPNSSISPHYGPCNLRLRIHLGLDIPDNCSITIADNQTTWKEGKCLVFDDTFIHSVDNKNQSKSRSILLFDVWHPDITEEEKVSIKQMFNFAKEKGWLNK